MARRLVYIRGDRVYEAGVGMFHSTLDIGNDVTVFPEIVTQVNAMGILRKFAKDNRYIIESHAHKVSNCGTPYHVTDYMKVEGGYLCLVNLPEARTIEPSVEVDVKLSNDSINRILEGEDSEILGHGVIEIDEDQYLEIGSCRQFQALPLLGYNLQHVMDTLGVVNTVFDDSTILCGGCGRRIWVDSGDHVGVDYDVLGISCGCYGRYVRGCYEDYIGDSTKTIELDVATELEGEGKLRHVERFIGGWTDGRGGYWSGYGSCEEGDPSEVLARYTEDNPGKSYLFSHDESGQFQTYFSVWEVI